MKRIELMLALLATAALLSGPFAMAPLLAQSTRSEESVRREAIAIQQEARALMAPQPPPPPPQESMPIAPAPAYVWMPGYWTWQNAWQWVPGHWELPPQHMITWVPGQWVQQGPNWVWHPGQWR